MTSASMENLKRLRELAQPLGLEIAMLETPTDDSTKAGKSKGASVSSPLSSPSVGSPESGESAVAFPQEVIKITMDTDLVEDDRFILRAGCIVPCDCVVISGRAVVDESALTGESMQVSKIP